MNKNILLINDDIRNYIKTLPDNSIDIIITDPPFNIGFDKKYDIDNDIFFEMIPEFYRVLKDNSWFIFWWSIKKIPEIYRIKEFIYKWQMICVFHSTYSKCAVGDRTFAPIFVYCKGKKPKVVFRRADMVLAEELPIVQCKIRSGDFKPTIALSQLLLMFTKENDLVFDPFMGFGSMGMVCKLFNRRYIGVEVDKTRFKIAQKLINECKITKPIPEMIEEFENKETKKNTLF